MYTIVPSYWHQASKPNPAGAAQGSRTKRFGAAAVGARMRRDHVEEVGDEKSYAEPSRGGGAEARRRTRPGGDRRLRQPDVRMRATVSGYEDGSTRNVHRLIEGFRENDKSYVHTIVDAIPVDGRSEIDKEELWGGCGISTYSSILIPESTAKYSILVSPGLKSERESKISILGCSFGCFESIKKAIGAEGVTIPLTEWSNPQTLHSLSTLPRREAEIKWRKQFAGWPLGQ
ncbi:hypothetical protein B0H12DRAFT_1080647 [Mycena haematopus]|nr:hypothetical protein B0H12DRAFT_1080647 [Mycena haematopus]